MSDDREKARRALDLQARARDYSLGEIPAYRAWSQRKLEEGESPAFIANLDASNMWLLPEEVDKVTESDFDELLQAVKEAVAKLHRYG